MSFAEYTSLAGQGRYCFLRVGNTVVVELARGCCFTDARPPSFRSERTGAPRFTPSGRRERTNVLATDQLLYLSILLTHIVNSEVEVRANRSSGLHVDGVQYLTSISKQRASSRRRTSNSSRPSGAPMARTHYY